MSYDLFLYAGSDYSVNLNLTNSDASPINLDGFGVKGIVKTQYSDTCAFLNLNPTIIDGQNGIINILVSGLQTEDLPITIGFYDICIFNQNTITSVLDGKVFINPNTTLVTEGDMDSLYHGGFC